MEENKNNLSPLGKEKISLDKKHDSIEYFEDTSSYFSKWINKYLKIYYSNDTKKPIGFKICEISQILHSAAEHTHLTIEQEKKLEKMMVKAGFKKNK